MNHAELRRHPRLEVDIPVGVVDTEGVARAGRLINLSTEGVLLAGDRQFYRYLVRAEERRKHEKTGPVEASVMFTLPGDKPCFYQVQCRMVHTRRLSQHLFHIGFKIIAFDKGEIEELGLFLRQSFAN